MADSSRPPPPPTGEPCLEAAAGTAEGRRLLEDAQRRKNWKRWGPYLPARQWGTVREDYSYDGDAWRYFPHEHAHRRAYRWGEDGLLGWTDRQCRLCFAVALWNERDPILKERLFGLSNHQGNHGEDVKELYFHLDATPTHSYCRALYKYPQSEFPYRALVEGNAGRDRRQRELELADLGVFDQGRYFDVVVEYAKADDNDILIRVVASNRGPEPAPLHVLPTLWFRNTWSWEAKEDLAPARPRLRRAGNGRLTVEHETLGRFEFACSAKEGDPPGLLFTENLSNGEALGWGPNSSAHVKDAFHRHVVNGETGACNPAGEGTKAAAHFRRIVPAGGAVTVHCRLWQVDGAARALHGAGFDRVIERRGGEAREYFRALHADLDEEEERVVNRAWAGLLWSKQFYFYPVADWLRGDPAIAVPPPQRLQGRNADWRHLYSRDVLLMPDTWEYPWFAAWDTAFHAVAVARIDPVLAKEQLVLLLREWYLHPNGQLPAYEFAFSDVNPPVHAWACWRVYKMTGAHGRRDVRFLARVFHKLLINFTWWVNRKDPEGRNIFSGGFLGLDNIGVFDRSRPLPSGGHLEQADATAWMAFYCTTMLAIALELADHDPAYEDIASKFFEHFVAIADAINWLGGTGLWDEQDGFYYDRVISPHGTTTLRVRSAVGFIPLFAGEILHDETLAGLPGFRRRMEWFITHRSDLAQRHAYLERDGGGKRLLAIPSRERLVRVLRYMLDPEEFLSPYGIRSLSRYHAAHPFELEMDGQQHRVSYAPGESDSALFGGNSNWRGPIWFPLNFLLIEALERYHHFHDGKLKVQYPTGSGRMATLGAVACDLSRRLASLFLPGEGGHRPAFGGERRQVEDPHFRDLLLFHEYFDGDTGRGCGASHQTGWTALVAKLIIDLASGGAGG